jgi:16S rRNA (guanine1207-N2)-methyltransferase
VSGPEAVYGWPPPGLAAVAAETIQVSPFSIKGKALEGLADGSLTRFVVAAPPGALERRYVLAHALRTLQTGGDLIALAPKQRGGLRLAAELATFDCAPAENARRHHRICTVRRPAQPAGLAEAISGGGPQWAPRLGMFSQPGIFSWDRPDSGSALLAEHLGSPAGRGADLGCGAGFLAREVLKARETASLILVDHDRRAIDAARRNITDPRARFAHLDVREPLASEGLDFVVMNPPFHHGGREDRDLSVAFVAAAAAMLRPGGVLRMVANVTLPYEALLAPGFNEVRQIARADGFKVLEARR